MNMAKTCFAYKCDRIVFQNEIQKGTIVVDANGKISKIFKGETEDVNLSDCAKVYQITKGVLMPGIVDSHVHINSPGRSEWEDFPCATRAAAAGGVTTLADMPLNSLPPTTTLENLRIKQKEALNSIFVDVAFWGGVIPGNQNELLKMINAGVVGFKCFLCPSGVDEFPCVTQEDLVKSAEVLKNSNSVLAFHAECELNANQDNSSKNPEEYNTYLNSRPPEMEHKALELIKGIAQNYDMRYHIVHVSASSGAKVITDMKTKGVRITAETCPHYLCLAAENVPSSATQYKCAPPVRSQTNQDELWQYVMNGDIDMIVSDHSPCTPELKTGGFLSAWGGISSLQFGLSLIWTHGVKHGISLVQISNLLSSAPAKLCRLNHQKGSLNIGLDADFIVFDPDDSYIVSESTIYHKNKLTPYLGMKLQGKVIQTYLRGKLIFDSPSFSDRPEGKLLNASL